MYVRHMSVDLPRDFTQVITVYWCMSPTCHVCQTYVSGPTKGLYSGNYCLLVYVTNLPCMSDICQWIYLNTTLRSLLSTGVCHQPVMYVRHMSVDLPKHFTEETIVHWCIPFLGMIVHKLIGHVIIFFLDITIYC